MSRDPMNFEEYETDEQGNILHDSNGNPIRIGQNPFSTQLPTVRIVNPDAPGTFVIINKKDFDPSKHELWQGAI